MDQTASAKSAVAAMLLLSAVPAAKLVTAAAKGKTAEKRFIFWKIKRFDTPLTPMLENKKIVRR